MTAEDGAPALRVVVDRDKCCGSGQCVLTAPEVFDQSDDDGLVMLLDPRPPAGSRGKVRNAAAFCPAGAISVEEAEAEDPLDARAGTGAGTGAAGGA